MGPVWITQLIPQENLFGWNHPEMFTLNNSYLMSSKQRGTATSRCPLEDENTPVETSFLEGCVCVCVCVCVWGVCLRRDLANWRIEPQRAWAIKLQDSFLTLFLVEELGTGKPPPPKKKTNTSFWSLPNDNQIFRQYNSQTFPKFIVVEFPQKNSVLGQFSLNFRPPPRAPPNANFINIVVSASLILPEATSETDQNTRHDLPQR